MLALKLGRRGLATILPLLSACDTATASAPRSTDIDGGIGGSDWGNVPAGCEGLLAEREATLPCDSPDRCAQAAAHEPNERREWLLGVRVPGSDLSDTEIAQRRDCLIAYADNLGMEASGIYSVHLVGSYTEVAPLLALDIVQSIEVYCIDRCFQCRELSEASCETDAFCQRWSASRYDSQQMCSEQHYILCRGEQEGGDGDVVTNAIDPEGGCWQFPNNAIPEGWAMVSGQPPDGGAICSYDQFEITCD